MARTSGSSVQDELKARIATTILSAAEPYIADWIITLGETGSFKRRKGDTLATKDRISAAKTGMDLVMKLFPDAGAAAGVTDLLKDLQGLEGSLKDKARETEREDGSVQPSDSW